MKGNQFPYRQKDTQPHKLLLFKSRTQTLIQTLNVERLDKYVLAIQKNLLKKQLDLYEWRQKTDFPIVKVESFKVVEQKIEKTRIQVILNSSYQRLSEFKDKNLQFIIYLLKQALVGFQRLFNKFKGFTVEPQMVIVDHKAKCRVWINETFYLNQVQGQAQNFQTFYKSIIYAFEQATIKNPASMSFFLSLKASNCFIKGLKYIEDFVKQKKLGHSTNLRSELKKISSTPNLFLQIKRVPNQQEQSKNMRQTIGNTKKRQNSQFKEFSNVLTLTFSAKNTRPLQKRIQKLIEQLPHTQIADRNKLVLQKFIGKKIQAHDQQPHQLKKIHKNFRQFKLIGRDTRQNAVHTLKPHNSVHDLSQLDTKKTDLRTQKSKAETTQNLYKSKKTNYPTEQLNGPQSKIYYKPDSRFGNMSRNRHQQEIGRSNMNQSRSASFIKGSIQRLNQRMCESNFNQISMSSGTKSGNIKNISQISHKKNSQMSEFNKEMQSLLYGFQIGPGNEHHRNSHTQMTGPRDIRRNKEISSFKNDYNCFTEHEEKYPRQLYSDQTCKNVSVLEIDEGLKECKPYSTLQRSYIKNTSCHLQNSASLTKHTSLYGRTIQSSKCMLDSNQMGRQNKYGEMKDDAEELCSYQINLMYEEWVGRRPFRT